MDFTREPIIESVITPKEGCKLVIRSSKGAGQEEFFVDAVEIVSFGTTFFLRSLEKPKAFLVPASDYEILEVRETRMVLKNVGIDRSIKIGGGKEAPKKKEPKPEPKKEAPEPQAEPKRKERRRNYRKKKGREEVVSEQPQKEEKSLRPQEKKINIPPPREIKEEQGEVDYTQPLRPTSSIIGSLLPPPPTLISETIERYKGNELFKDVFYPKETSQPALSEPLEDTIPLEEPWDETEDRQESAPQDLLESEAESPSTEESNSNT